MWSQEEGEGFATDVGDFFLQNGQTAIFLHQNKSLQHSRKNH